MENTKNSLSNIITILDLDAIGNDLNIDALDCFGKVEVFNTTSSSEVLARVKDSTIIITNKVEFDSELLKQLPKLKLICIAATGMNNIDLQAAKNLGIQVKNVAGYSTKSVAQLTLTYALNFLCSFQDYTEYTANKTWAKSKVFCHLEFPFHNLDQKKWGIIGLGTIGLEVARLAKAFGCSVQYYSTSGKNKNTEYTEVQLDELLTNSDIISIHAPLNNDTKNLIRKRELALIKKDGILINVGRGGIINEVDLATALDELDIKVATDVLEQEPLSLDSPLSVHLGKKKLILTPHIAWSSLESREKLWDGIIKNIKAHLKN